MIPSYVREVFILLQSAYGSKGLKWRIRQRSSRRSEKHLLSVIAADLGELAPAQLANESPLDDVVVVVACHLKDEKWAFICLH